uniref:Putative ovule protein n=1 Tax=Solanum chacoense TaxID=4108 RepID=A0A0V0HKE8_SOLCH
MFGIDFKGHEKETLELLMQIDGSRQAKRMEPITDIKKIRSKGSLELKNLITFDVKFKSGGGRSNGKGKTQNDQ